MFVKTLTGRTITLDVSQGDFIMQVKIQISKKEGIPVDQYSLRFSGKNLENHFTLADYKIRSEDTMILVLKLRGGCCQFVDLSNQNGP